MVKINIEVDTGRAMSKIETLRGELSTLDDTADDIDLDFGGDLDGLTENVRDVNRDLTTMKSRIETVREELGEEIEKLADIDDIDVKAKHEIRKTAEPDTPGDGQMTDPNMDMETTSIEVGQTIKPQELFEEQGLGEVARLADDINNISDPDDRLNLPGADPEDLSEFYTTTPGRGRSGRMEHLVPDDETSRMLTGSDVPHGRKVDAFDASRSDIAEYIMRSLGESEISDSMEDNLFGFSGKRLSDIDDRIVDRIGESEIRNIIDDDVFGISGKSLSDIDDKFIDTVGEFEVLDVMDGGAFDISDRSLSDMSDETLDAINTAFGNNISDPQTLLKAIRSDLQGQALDKARASNRASLLEKISRGRASEAFEFDSLQDKIDADKTQGIDLFPNIASRERLSGLDITREELIRSAEGLNPDRKSRRGLLGRLRKRIDFTDRFKRATNAMGDALGKLAPSIGQIYNLVAAVLPVVIALGANLYGVAAAFGAVAAAGASILALGLFGRGDTMAQSFDSAKEKVSELATEIFNLTNDSMAVFAPVQERMFAAIPGEIDAIAESMEGLVAYEGTLFELGSEFSTLLQDGAEAAAENEAAVSQLVLRFAELADSGVRDIVGFLFNEARNNQDLMAELGSDFASIAKAIYNFSLAVATIVSAFSPVINILQFMSGLLENRIVEALVAMVGYMYLFGKTTMFVVAMGRAFQALASWIASTNAMNQAWNLTLAKSLALATALAATMAAITFGISALAGGALGGASLAGTTAPDISSGRGGGATVYQDNSEMNVEFNGDTSDYSDQQNFKDMLERAQTRNSATERPDVDNPTTDRSDRLI